MEHHGQRTLEEVACMHVIDARAEPVLAAKEAVRLVGYGLGNLMWRISEGAVHKPDWTEEDRGNVRGTNVFLLGGSICTQGYTGHLLPSIARSRLIEIDPDFGRAVTIFKPNAKASRVGAFGAYFMALDEATRSTVHEYAKRSFFQHKIPIIPLLDIGGTKVSLVLAYVARNGELTLDVFQEHEFASPVGDAETFYDRLASLIAPPLSDLKQNRIFDLIPIVSVGQPGRFEDGSRGRIGQGTARDLGPNFAGRVPSHLLQNSLRPYLGEMDVYCANDGRSQFIGIGALSRRERPTEWSILSGRKVAYLGLGTGLGAGFGSIDSTTGHIQPYSMHNAFDIIATERYEELPPTRYLSPGVLCFPYAYGDLLSGRFVRRFMTHVDATRLSEERDLVFLPLSSARAVAGEADPVRSLLTHDERLSPLNGVLLNEVLSEHVIAAMTEEIIDTEKSELEKKLRDALSVIATEIDSTLTENIQPSNYDGVIEEVARAKGRGRPVQFLGVGKSYLVGRNLASIFCDLGINSTSGELTGADFERLANLQRGDVVFLISHSGSTVELLGLLPYLDKNGCRTVAITGDQNSALAQRCSYFLKTFVARSLSPAIAAPITSTIAALASGTAIGIVVANRVEYDAGKLVSGHPHFVLGENTIGAPIRTDPFLARLTRVEDIFQVLATCIRGLWLGADSDFVPGMISLTKRILVSYENDRVVFFTGAGTSLHVAEKIAATLTNSGIEAYTLNPVQIMHGDFARIRRGDLLIIISFSGETRLLVRIRDLARQKGIDIAVLTMRSGSTLACVSDNELCIVAGEYAHDKSAGLACNSSIVASFVNLTIGDTLAVILSPVLPATRRGPLIQESLPDA
jgi:arabinose-5-phosphate isomerase